MIYWFCNTNSCNLCYKTDVGGLCLLLGASKYLWRSHCNKTTCVLKRRVTASRRFKNYQKRLITFGFTVRNGKLFLRKSFEETLSSLLEFLARKLFSELSGEGKYVFPEFCFLKNNFTFDVVNPKVINGFG